MKMHDGELDIDVELVRRLVAEQFPRFADLPLRAYGSTGTVNGIYRLGDHLYVRLPLMPEWAEDVAREWHWLPKLAPRVSLQVPEPVGKGDPSDLYPLSWAIYRWIEGQPYADEIVDDEQQAAKALAQFVLELRQIAPVVDTPAAGRRPLRELDATTRTAIESARGVIDSGAAATAWKRALESPAWTGKSVWIHADLLRPNLLVRDGRLAGVIDFGGAGVGDPAADVIAAWSVFGPAGRETYRRALEVDDDTWNRARGFALHQAAQIIPYYRKTNPRFVALARRTVEEVLADVS